MSYLLSRIALPLLVAALPLVGQAQAPPAALAPERELTQLARALRQVGSADAYARLAGFAERHARSPLGARAALALGYYDYTKGSYTQAKRWLDRAGGQVKRLAGEPLLREYVLYWQSQANLGLGLSAEALSQLEEFRRSFPESVMGEQAVTSLAEAALLRGEPQRALAALDAYDDTATQPGLLLRRAQAREAAQVSPEELVAAARDYQDVYDRFPLSAEAQVAESKLALLAGTLGERFPEAPLEQKASRADAQYEARRWREARAAYEELLPKLSGAERERATLRMVVCAVQLGEAPGTLSSLVLTDSELDAERLYLLAQFLRGQKQEAELLAVVEQLATRYPQSRWAEEGLFAAGNYFWVNLDRARAASYYRQVFDRFPAGKNALTAHWRLAWVAYLERRAEAGPLLEEHLRRFPGTPYTVDALYWLGRLAEREAKVAHARSFYAKARERFPQTYFGRQAAGRLRALGEAPVNAADFLALIPGASLLLQFDEAIPASASDRWARAQALASIAFDASAELELRAAYSATGSLRLLWETAKAAVAAGRYPAGIVTARQLFPELEARRFEELPADAWRTVYPLPFVWSIKRSAARHKLDPMLVAGMIRQESAFQPEAVSPAGAVGLMQVLPKTGLKLARQLRLRYSRARLFEPEYNLRLGTRYLADLLRLYRSREAALAAYNAGEERVDAWQAERRFEEPAEFVESIPFTETREYVQIVMRNAEIYRSVHTGARGAR